MIAIDVGNSKVKIAIFEGEYIRKRYTLDTDRCTEIEFFQSNIKGALDKQVIAFSSVVPAVSEIIKKVANSTGIYSFDIKKAKDKILIFDYEISQLGGDRLANVVAAYKRYSPPILVVDFGTATTYDVISSDGHFLGGVISPGIRTSIDFLVNRTGLLPGVSLQYPEGILGNNTKDAIVSGFYYTFVGQMKEMTENIKKIVGRELTVVGTGGLLEFAKRDFPEIIPDYNLTLYGIKILYETNR